MSAEKVAAVTETIILSAAQIAAARTLAAAYGHEWACWPEDRPATADEIHAYVIARRHPDALPGITGPFAAAEGVIRHTTGTGRLTWEVGEDGGTVLVVCRPGNISVLWAEVLRSGKEVNVWRDQQPGHEPYYQRQVVALTEALAALVGEDRATTATTKLIPGAVDGALRPAAALAVEGLIQRLERVRRKGVWPLDLDRLREGVECLAGEVDLREPFPDSRLNADPGDATPAAIDE